MRAPIPEQETARLEALQRYRILDTAPEEAFDDLTKLASFICQTPIAMISLVDQDRQWFKSKLGIQASETPRSQAFCAHTICNPGLMVVEDATLDDRFADSMLVTGDPHIRFYAGMPLRTSEGHGLGALCVVDRQPRQLRAEQASALESLSRLVVTNLELRRVSHELSEAVANIKTLSGLVPICSFCKGVRNDKGYWEEVEEYIETHTNAAFTHSVCPNCRQKHFPKAASA